MATKLRYTLGTMAGKLLPQQYFLLAVLFLVTIPLVWKAKSLEKRLFGHNEAALLNKPAPEFSLKTLAGDAISTKDFRGKKKLVVSFWASWCGPCRMELPELEAFYEKYHAEGTFEVLAISTDEDPKEAERYVRESKLSFPVLWDENGKTEDAFRVESIPKLFVIDENGKVIFAEDGYEFGLAFRLQQSLDINKDDSQLGAANVVASD
jgi:cytochrome c biogenesis protein CcmG/thiol:disulfide interchange protein DsbE